MKDSNTQFQLLRDDLITGQMVSLSLASGQLELSYTKEHHHPFLRAVWTAKNGLQLGYSWTVSRTIKATIKKLMEQIEWDVDHISF